MLYKLCQHKAMNVTVYKSKTRSIYSKNWIYYRKNTKTDTEWDSFNMDKYMNIIYIALYKYNICYISCFKIV